MKVIKVLGVQTHYLTPSGQERLSSVDWWRVANPLKSVARNHDDIKVDFVKKIVKEGVAVEDAYEDIGEKYDILYTSYMDTAKAYAWIKAACERYGMKHVMDMDDNIFDVDEMNPASIKYSPGSETLKNATIIIGDVEYMTTSTEHLANVLSAYRTKRPVVLPNYIDETIYNYDKKVIEPHEGLYIGYQGSSTHYADFMNTGVMFALRRLLAEYPHVKFYTIGMAFDEMKRYFPEDKFVVGRGERDHRRWRDAWRKMPIDIGLAPLVNSSFNMAKSSIKYYEYGMRKIPAVYSWVEPYLQVVKEHETGYLAQSELEWYEKVKILIEDETKRKDMAEKARKDVLANYTIKDHQEDVYKFLKGVHDNSI